MSAPRSRRPPIATSVSAPDVFGRPMDPTPAPLVYINGGHGIGKETVAECLTLLLGRDKSLLIDARTVGRETAGTRSPKRHHHAHRHDNFDPGYDHNSPLITPEHPRYFSPEHFNPDRDPDQDPDHDEDQDQDHDDLPTPSSSPSSSRSTSFSSTTTTTTTSTDLLTITTDLPTITTTTTSPSTSQPPETYCSAENLFALLSHPPNRSRIAILPARAPDTPAGRAALRAFEAAAARAGRVFVCVDLACEPRELARRAMSLPLGWLPLGAASAGVGRRDSFGFGAGGDGDGGRGGRRLLSLPVPLEVGQVDEGRGGGWEEAREALAVPVRAGLTVDVTRVPAFEAALQILEFVRGLEGEGDVEMCGGGGRGRGDEDDDDKTPVPVGRVEEEALARGV